MKPIRVALSGSGFRLPAHIGALHAIAESGYQPIELSGTSGGSIVASLFASGMSLDDMETLAMTMDWSPMMTFDPWSGLRNGGYCAGSALLSFLTDKTSGKTFADLSVDLKVIASDLLTEKQVVFSKATTPSMPVALAARASASIPFVYVPVAYNGLLCVDGGCCDNMPADELTADDVPRLGVYLVSDDGPLAPGSYGPLTIASRVIDLMLASNEAAHVDAAQKNGAKVLHVPTGYASSLDRNMTKSMRQRLFNDGYAAAMAALA